MAQDDTTRCPFCAELIQKDAVKCRYCGSWLGGQRPVRHEHWTRVNRGKKIAGVCTGIAAEVNTPQMVLPLRISFLISFFFGGFGLFLYLILWILMPSPADSPVPWGIPVQPPDLAESPEPKAGKKQRVYTWLKIILIILFSLLLAFTVLSFIEFMRHLVINFHSTRITPSYPFGNGWSDIRHFRFFPWSLPVSTIFFIMVALILLFLLSTNLFRLGCGCISALVAIAIVVVLLPLLIAGVIFPVVLLLPVRFVAAIVALILMVIKALLD